MEEVASGLDPHSSLDNYFKHNRVLLADGECFDWDLNTHWITSS